jgi:uncharacterized flavoprotein (TIGR03862 family)
MVSSPPTLAVIGGGPAGLIAAQTLAEGGARVTLFERMPTLGRKFLMAGRGGLNLTHSEDLERFLTRYGAARPALEAAMRGFSPDDLQRWCRALGEETFIGSSGRVFPKSFKASPLLRAFIRHLDNLGVTFHLRHRWTGWNNGALTFETPDGPTMFNADATILALGGASWPRLGSDGGWTRILAAEGVAITPLTPANAGVEIGWSPVFADRFAGEPLKRIAVVAGDKAFRGEAMVTREGLEGGAIYAALPALRSAPSLTLDLRPDMARDAIAAKLEAPRGKDTMSTFLRKRLSLAPVAIGLLREAASVALPSSPDALAALTKGVTLKIAGIRPLEKAISSAGGVRFAALDERFMAKSHPGLFIAGEMLDWEAPTGGYLLQASFATGVAAARGALEWTAG